MYFKKLILLTVLLLAMLTIAILLLINDPQPTLDYINYPFPGNAPGDKDPYLGHCYPMESPILFCLIAKNSIVFDTSEHKILISTITQEHLSAGYLISQWGTPTSAQYYTGEVVLVFGTKTAIIYTDHYSPVSKVRYINYNSNLTELGAYKGYITNLPQ